MGNSLGECARLNVKKCKALLGRSLAKNFVVCLFTLCVQLLVIISSAVHTYRTSIKSFSWCCQRMIMVCLSKMGTILSLILECKEL